MSRRIRQWIILGSMLLSQVLLLAFLLTGHVKWIAYIPKPCLILWAGVAVFDACLGSANKD